MQTMSTSWAHLSVLVLPKGRFCELRSAFLVKPLTLEIITIVDGGFVTCLMMFLSKDDQGIFTSLRPRIG